MGTRIRPPLAVAFVALLWTASPAAANDADDIVAYTNQIRAKHGLPPLRVNRSLSRAASYHARNQAYQFRYSHYLDGLDYVARSRRFGYPSSYVSENIHCIPEETRDPTRKAVSGWMRSPAHRKNILDPNVTEIGVGIAYGHGYYFYVQVLGTR